MLVGKCVCMCYVFIPPLDQLSDVVLLMDLLTLLLM